MQQQQRDRGMTLTPEEIAEGWLAFNASDTPLPEFIYGKFYPHRGRTTVHVVVCWSHENVWQAPGGEMWWGPPSAWKPLPEGLDPVAAEHQLWGYSPAPKPAPAPPVVHVPGDTSVRLTATPRDILLALRDGGRLRERVRNWSSFELAVPGCQHLRSLQRRAVDVLTSNVFAARSDEPPYLTKGEALKSWVITEHGLAWLEANVKPKAAAAAATQETATP
jgi:hypothetical protein